MKRFKYISSLLLASSLLYMGCKKEETATTISLDDFLKSKSELSMFASAMDKAGLQAYKNGPGPFTWFAPTNEAFIAAGVTADSLNKMTSGTISYYLMYHLINNESFSTSSMAANISISKSSNIGSTAPVFVGQLNNDFYVNGTKIINPDVKVSNGLVHVINRFHVPQTLTGNLQAVLNGTGQHTLFIAALNRASPNRWTPLGTTSVFTVLAPNDAAMTAAGYTTASIAAAPTARMDSLVRYHYFSGLRLFTNDLGNKVSPSTALGLNRTITGSANGTKVRGKNNANPVDIVASDRLGTNGVVHTINGVLLY